MKLCKENFDTKKRGLRQIIWYNPIYASSAKESLPSFVRCESVLLDRVDRVHVANGVLLLPFLNVPV